MRLERNPDPAGPRRRVLAGDTRSPILVGYVDAAHTAAGARSSNRWTALTPDFVPVNRRARNRTEALVVLVDNHQRATAHT